MTATITYLVSTRPCRNWATNEEPEDNLAKLFCENCGYHYTDHKNLSQDQMKEIESD